MSSIHAPSRLDSVADFSRLMLPIRKEQPVSARRPGNTPEPVYPWSLNPTPRTTITTFSVRASDNRCPPEAYLG
jgi:hypothetical protein